VIARRLRGGLLALIVIGSSLFATPGMTADAATGVQTPPNQAPRAPMAPRAPNAPAYTPNNPREATPEPPAEPAPTLEQQRQRIGEDMERERTGE
jgi:hypothetical protein